MLTPPPTPEIRGAALPLNDLEEAVKRAQGAWNRSQLEDALRSIRYHLARVERVLERDSA